MSARDAILGRIGSALGGGDRATLPDAVRERLEARRRSTQPGFGTSRFERLVEQMATVQMTHERIDAADGVVAAVTGYLERERIEPPVMVAPALDDLDWPPNWRADPLDTDVATAVTPCLGAVAETGSIALGSGRDTPMRLHFLPDNHVIVLYESQVVDHLEDFWPTLRAMSPLPRAMSFVTGPSRTADIEQTLEIGAHGPRRVHVLLVAGAP